MLVGAAPVLTVQNIAASIEYDRDVLGFDVTFRYGTPVFYACLCRNDVNLHLIAAEKTERLPGDSAVSVFVDNVDELHAELSAKGAKVLKAPENYDYGMREFNVIDLDGNQLFFGMGTGPEA